MSRNPAGRPNGRPTSEVTTRCQAIVERAKLFEVLADIAQNAKQNADRISAIKLLTAYAYGQPAQKMDLTSAGKPLLVLGTP